MDCIFAKKPRFGSGFMIFGYFLSCIGLTMLYRPELRAVGITGVMGILVGLMVVWSRKQPRYNLLLPVFAAAVVSTLIFRPDSIGFHLRLGQSARYSPDHISARRCINHRDD